MKKLHECRCKTKEHGILLYMVVSFDYVDKTYWLHSVDRTKEVAEAHKLMIQNDYLLKCHRATVRIEIIESDHAFGQSMRM
jgi:hypothetical protein